MMHTIGPLHSSPYSVRQLVRDPQASVRLRLLDVLGDWLLRLPDRRAHDARLVPYLLALLNDPVQVTTFLLIGLS